MTLEHLFLLGLISILIWRIVLPSMRLVGSEKNGKEHPVVEPTGGATTPPKSVREWVTGHPVDIALGIADAIIFFWWIYKPGLKLAGVGDWSLDNWVPLCAFWIITLILIVRNTKEDKVLGGKLRGVLHLVMFMLFIGIPVGIWVRNISLPEVVCPKGTAGETRSCVLNTRDARIEGAPNDPGVFGKRLCFLPKEDVTFERFVTSGGTYWTFRAKKDTVVLRYRFMDTCPEKNM